MGATVAAHGIIVIKAIPKFAPHRKSFAVTNPKDVLDATGLDLAAANWQ